MLLDSFMFMFERVGRFEAFDYEKITGELCHKVPLSFQFTTAQGHSHFRFRERIEVRGGKCYLVDHVRFKHMTANGTIIKASLAPVSLKAEMTKQINQTITAYSRFYSDRKLQNAGIQAGTVWQKDKGKVESSLSLLLRERRNQYFCYCKALYLGTALKGGIFWLIDLRSKISQANGATIEYSFLPNVRVSLRAESEIPSSYPIENPSTIDFYAINCIAKASQTLSLLTQLKYYPLTDSRVVEGLLEKHFQQKRLKVGMNSLGNLLIQMRFPLKGGKGSNFEFGLEIADLLKSRKISYGFRVNIAT